MFTYEQKDNQGFKDLSLNLWKMGLNLFLGEKFIGNWRRAKKGKKPDQFLVSSSLTEQDIPEHLQST